MSDRKEFTGKTKRAAFERCCVDGVPRCEGAIPSMRDPQSQERCGVDLRSKPFHYDHDDADYFSKDNSLDNCVVLCVPCHVEKTKTVDTPKIKKARAIYRARTKTKARRGPPMPGSRDSRVKRKVDGTLIERATGKVLKEGRR